MMQSKAWEPIPPYTSPTTPPAPVLPTIRTSRSVDREVLCREIAAQEGAASVARRNHKVVLKINGALANAMKVIG